MASKSTISLTQKIIALIKDLYYYSIISVLLQMLVNSILFIYHKLFWKLSIIHTDEKPSYQKHYLVVSNHRSMKDPPLIGYSLGIPVSFIAKKELFRNKLLTIFMILMSTVSIDRENAKSSTIKEALKAMKTKAFNFAWSSVIFIEGTRSQDPQRLGKPNKGALLIAKLAKVPILPIGISYRNKNEIVIKIGKAYEIDEKEDLESQAWQCLEKISKLTDYELPNKD